MLIYSCLVSILIQLIGYYWYIYCFLHRYEQFVYTIGRYTNIFNTLVIKTKTKNMYYYI